MTEQQKNIALVVPCPDPLLEVPGTTVVTESSRGLLYKISASSQKILKLSRKPIPAIVKSKVPRHFKRLAVYLKKRAFGTITSKRSTLIVSHPQPMAKHSVELLDVILPPKKVCATASVIEQPSQTYISQRILNRFLSSRNQSEFVNRIIRKMNGRVPELPEIIDEKDQLDDLRSDEDKLKLLRPLLRLHYTNMKPDQMIMFHTNGCSFPLRTLDDMLAIGDREGKFTLTSRTEGLLGGGRTKGRRGKPKTKKKRRQPMIQIGSLNFRPRGIFSSRVPTFGTRFNFTSNGVITSDATGAVNARFSLRNPLRAFNGGVVDNDAAAFGANWDRYRPEWLCVHLFRLQPLTESKGELVVVVDNDDPDNNTPNWSNDNQYEPKRFLGPAQSKSIWIKIKRLMSGTWLDDNQDPPEIKPIVSFADGYFDFRTPPLEGNLYIGGLDFPSTTNVYRWQVTLYGTADGRR